MKGPPSAPGVFGPEGAGSEAREAEEKTGEGGVGGFVVVVQGFWGAQAAEALHKGEAHEEEHGEPHRHVVVYVADGFVKNVEAWNGVEQTPQKSVGDEEDGQKFVPVFEHVGG